MQIVGQVLNSIVREAIRYWTSPSGMAAARYLVYKAAKPVVENWYHSLSKEQQKRVDEIIWWAAKKALSSVLSEAAGEAVQKIAEILGFMNGEIAQEITAQVTSKAAELSVDYLKEKSKE